MPKIATVKNPAAAQRRQILDAANNVALKRYGSGNHATRVTVAAILEAMTEEQRGRVFDILTEWECS